jgi:hypothetical protein
VRRVTHRRRIGGHRLRLTDNRSGLGFYYTRGRSSGASSTSCNSVIQFSGDLLNRIDEVDLDRNTLLKIRTDADLGR